MLARVPSERNCLDGPRAHTRWSRRFRRPSGWRPLVWADCEFRKGKVELDGTGKKGRSVAADKEIR